MKTKNIKFNFNFLLILFSLFLLASLITIKYSLFSRTYHNEAYKYSLKYPSDGKIIISSNEEIILYENKNIKPIPENSDVDTPTKYIRLSVKPLDIKSSIEQEAMKGLSDDMLASKEDFMFNRIVFRQFCFDTSSLFCEVFTINNNNLYKFSLRGTDSWADSKFYKQIFSSFIFDI